MTTIPDHIDDALHAARTEQRIDLILRELDSFPVAGDDILTRDELTQIDRMITELGLMSVRLERKAHELCTGAVAA